MARWPEGYLAGSQVGCIAQPMHAGVLQVVAVAVVFCRRQVSPDPFTPVVRHVGSS